MDANSLITAVSECAEDVNESLGPDLSETAYHRALVTCLSDRGVRTSTETTIPVMYRGNPVARVHPDLIVGDDARLIVELKAGDTRDKHERQLSSYLRLNQAGPGDTVYGGLLIAFGDELEIEQIHHE